MRLHLVSFKTCPYVQRSVITLKEKGVPFDITYIDLADPPDWFKEKSPLGKVPILDTDEGVLFESAVINEYVDEVTEGSLMPESAWDQAQTRAWIEFGAQCLSDYFQAAISKDEGTFLEHVGALKDKLGRLQERFVGPFFLGDEFTLADAAMAPLLMRLQQMSDVADQFDLAHYPELNAWAERLVSRPAVENSITPEWRELNMAFIRRNGGYLASLAA